MPKQSFHYFATSIANWETHEDLGKLIKLMDQRARYGKQKLDYTIYKVLLPQSADYRIEDYLPVVPEGTLQFIEQVKRAA